MVDWHFLRCLNLRGSFQQTNPPRENDCFRFEVNITKEKYPDILLKIEAQAALNVYYQQFNFQPIGEVYLVDGIPHQLMILKH